MANLQRTPVSYRPFTGQAVLADGLLAVDRPGGEALASVAKDLFQLGNMFEGQANQEAQRRGVAAAEADALANRPRVSVSGGDPIMDRPAPASGQRSPTDERAPVFTNAPAPKNTISGPPEVVDAISKAAARYGVPVSAMLQIAKIESRLKPDAKNPNSSAGGLFQQTDGNAARYGVSNRFDPYQSADGAARFMRDNIAYLTQKLGRAPTAGELYLAHQQGAGGAAKLLTNPSAPAVAVVGRKAVLGNGGNDRMTAGEFASMWTRRVNGGEVGLTYSSSVDRRTPIEISATGSMPLTGRNSIFGRAYDETMTRQYSASLNDEMLTAGSQLYEKLKDSPEDLQAAFMQLKERQLSDHVSPGVQLDYERAFDKMSQLYLAKAQAEREDKIDKQERADYADAGSRYSESFNRSLVGIDPAKDQSVTVASAEAARLKDYYREGAARGYWSQATADQRIADIDGRVKSTFYVKQAEGKSAAEIAALHTQLKEDYVAGKLEGVDGDAWSRIDSGLDQLERAKKADDARQQSEVAKTAGNLIDRVTQGYTIDETEIAQLAEKAHGLPEGEAIVKATTDVLEIGKALREGPLSGAEKKLDELKKSIGDTPTDRQRATVKTAEAMIAQARKTLAADPLGYAEKAGVIQEAGSLGDVQTAGDLEALVSKRVGLADQVSKHFGIEARVFRPGETAAIDKMLKEDPAQGALMAGAIIKGAGPRAFDTLNEFGKSAPVMTAAGAIIAGGGSPQAAEDAIAGSGKTPEGKPYSVKGQDVRRAAGVARVSSAMPWQPKDGARIVQAAEWIARKRMYDQGVEFDAPEAQDIYNQALQEAAGATFDGQAQYGGFVPYDPGGWLQGSHDVIAPPEMRADKFDDVIDALQDSDFPVKPKGGVDAIKSLWPVYTAYGYLFVDMDRGGNPAPIMGEDGKPFVLDFTRLAPVLAKRVPGSFRGY